MASDFYKNLEKMIRHLNSNGNIKQIFNTADFNKSDETFSSVELFKEINWDKLFSYFVITFNYLFTYAYKNDDNFDNTIELNNLYSDIYDELNLNYEHYKKIIKYEPLHNKILFLKAQELCLMYSVSSFITRDISNLIDSDLELKYKPLSTEFYRGHSDASYKLIPSLYRNYNIACYGNTLNYSILYNLYDRCNFISKYKNLFEKVSNIDMKFCAFAQHSTSYSPLLDLTTDHIIALSFATVFSGDVNSYSKRDAAIYKFSFRDSIDEATDNDLKNIYAYFVDNKLRPYSTYEGKPLFYCIPEDFNPEIKIWTKFSNDRMKYQKGAFLFFKSCVVVNGYVLMPYKLGNITKYIIKADEIKGLNKKSEIYTKILKKHRHYDYEHLMDPYLYFSEVSEK